ncbi:hypothetical protein BGZ70_006659 [Mortierella alpina]|uniref:Structure-specific endonuclease subunit SLX4 n=1 Tax=Mortierella alpina TaxID=64518 RepID=A0A9P6J859_MORAP|nr:hypothetical protein BGZ70_006659 [Mortierella alpina]
MSFSLALSVLNIVPARHLDGHHALTAFVALFSSIQRSYKSTRSLRLSLAECLLEGGAALTAASSSLSTATFARGTSPFNAMGAFDEEDEDDDFAPSTPHTLRIRNALPPKSPGIKRPTPNSSSLPQSSQQQKQQQRQQQSRKEQSKQPPQPTQTTVDQESSRQQTHSEHGTSSTAEPVPSRPRNGVPLSLRKPAAAKITALASRVEATSNATTTYSPLAHTSNTGASAGVIVLDSESEGHSDAEDLIRRPSRPSPGAPLDLAATQVGGVSTSPRRCAISILSAQGDEMPPSAGPQNTNNQLTQNSISSSQGSVDLMEEERRDLVMDDSVFYSQEDAYAHTYRTQWSLSPDIANPFLTDLVPTPTLPAETVPTLSPGTSASNTVDFVGRVESTVSSTLRTDETSAVTMETDFSLSGYDLEQDRDGSFECCMCGKSLIHLDEARVAYHINDCIDEQQVMQQTAESLDLDSRIPHTSLSQGEFAGAQVDYLSRVKRCPICKLDWPLKAKQTKSGFTAPKKARQKVEHMKKCAKAHNRTVQSLLYQIRLLKEKYERSLMLDTSMDSSDLIGPSQEMYQNEDEERGSGSDQDDTNDVGSSGRRSASGDTQVETGAESASGSAARKSKPNSTVIKQVVSMTDTADGDFESDAVITTVHAPAPPSSKSRLSRLQRMHEDQNDDHLQLALAISMSVSSAQDSGSPFLSRPGSPSESGPRATTWSMVPMSKTASRRGGKRRKTERERNETTVLPFAEVQQLIQANATALLFPETEEFGHVEGDGHDRLLKTPPWKPSRFAGMTKADLEMSLSQSSEPDATVAESLWNLSRLKDTRDIDALDLHGGAEQTAVDSDGESKQDPVLQKDQQPKCADPSKAIDTQKLLPTFDREQYVSRFMKRFLKQDQDKSSSYGSANVSIESSHLKSSSEDEPSDSHGAASRQSDNKFSSPLWSVAKARRISLKDQRQENEEMFSNTLKNEISGHLEALERCIQQAKLTAYHKIMESIRRHPIAAGLSAELSDPDVIEQGSDCEPMDEDAQDLDASQQPSSPLLRFAKAADLERSASPATLGVHSSQPISEISPAHNDGGLRDYYADHGGGLDDYTSMDMYQDDLPYEDYDQACMMAYSPSASPVMVATTPRAFSPSDINVMSSPVMPATGRDASTSAYGLGILTPSGLPPPVDFVKLMQRVSGTVTEAIAESEQLISDIEGVGPKQSKAKTHRRRSQSANPIDRRGSASGSRWEDEARPPLGVPPRPRSALEVRTAIASSSRREQGLNQGQTTPKRSALHGLPLRKPFAMPPTATAAITTADDDGDLGVFDDAQYPASQRATFPTSQPANRNLETVERTMPAPSIPTTPSRTNRNQLQDTDAGSATPSQVGTPTGGASKTPSKRRRLAVVRAEAMAAESAKAVANIKAQSRMPLYHLMSVARLRLAATTFGLKPASKGQLVQQLTALWKTLNPTPPQGEEAAGGGNGGQGSGLSPSGIAAGADDGLFDEDEDMNEFGISHSQSLRRALGDRSDDNDAGLEDGGVGSSGTQVLELDSDCSPIVSEVEDLVAGEDEEDDECEDDEEEDEVMVAARTGLGIDFAPSQEDGSGTTTPTLERQLYEFLNTTTHLRKQILTYKPLDLEQVWEECKEANIDCTRQQLRQFLDQQGIICFVPAHSSLGSWRKTRAKKRKRVGK